MADGRPALDEIVGDGLSCQSGCINLVFLPPDAVLFEVGVLHFCDVFGGDGGLLTRVPHFD